jgi:hypothetical protein
MSDLSDHPTAERMRKRIVLDLLEGARAELWSSRKDALIEIAIGILRLWSCQTRVPVRVDQMRVRSPSACEADALAKSGLIWCVGIKKPRTRGPGLARGPALSRGQAIEVVG